MVLNWDQICSPGFISGVTIWEVQIYLGTGQECYSTSWTTQNSTDAESALHFRAKFLLFLSNPKGIVLGIK